MKHTASFTVSLPADQAQAILQALEPEAADGPEGTQTRLSMDGDAIRIDIDADDVSGLRAAMNSILRLMDAAVRVG